MSNENQNQTITNNTASNEVVVKPSFKDKISNYIKEHPSFWAWAIGIFVFLFVVISFIYYNYFYQSPIEKFADKFCACADESKSDFYNYAKDGFGYRSDLNSCFAEDFKAYSEDFDKVEKKKMLEYFQQQVIIKCPEKLSNVFENK